MFTGWESFSRIEKRIVYAVEAQYEAFTESGHKGIMDIINNAFDGIYRIYMYIIFYGLYADRRFIILLARISQISLEK